MDENEEENWKKEIVKTDENGNFGQRKEIFKDKYFRKHEL